MREAVQESHPQNGPAPPLERPALPVERVVSTAVLSCVECGAVTQVELGNGSLTCDCGGMRRIVKIVDGAQPEPKGQ